MKKTLGALVFLIIISVPLQAQETLVFSTIEGHALVEPVSQIVREAYLQLGIEVKIKGFPSERALHMTSNGQVDGELGRMAGIDETYPDLRMVSVPILFAEGVVFTKVLKFAVEGWESLKTYKIGIIRGMKYAENGTQGMETQVVTKPEQLFRMLDAGRIDVAILHRSVGLSTL